ncbi:hypothetical protein GCM10009738_88490 [Kitasatospora viridis]|uniref:RimJ/RimL family protein N-acetyltransferase n=1 Tax=Kitasatospora viridis TaxID=281105 RepID=A0A561SDM2_9ACTN|nr:RimJ/RimL family protein N-acetyltransferase [Kitasatospora viridis]
MPELTPLHADHAPAVLAFELASRAYFAASISDRGDGFFERFDEQFRDRLDEQATGDGAFYLLVDEPDGSVLGRFNLVDLADGGAVLGYRVAQRVAGRGVASATVRRLCRLAAVRHGLRELRAAVSHQNVASQRVLANAGFTPVGPAGPADLGGKEGTWYRRELAEAGRGLAPLVASLTALAAEAPAPSARIAADFDRARRLAGPAPDAEVLAELTATGEALRGPDGSRAARVPARRALTALLGSWRLPLPELRGPA